MAGDFMVITLNVYLLRVLYQFPPLCSSVDGIFVADGVKTELRLRVALLGSCFAVTGKKPRICSKWSLWSAGCGSWSCEPVWASRLGEALAKTEDLSKPEWLFGLFIQVFGAGSAAELLEQHYAFPIHLTQIPAAQHELYPSVAITITGIQICSGL
jgi:hypothetical protein